MEKVKGLPPDMEEVREQLEQQNALAAQLREKLQQDELQLANKELQNEHLRSKLTLIQSRSRAKRESGGSQHFDNAHPKTEPAVKKSTPTKTNKGKMNILREQLEQNRLRFERHGQELHEESRSMEAMVEQLRHKLEEGDVTIEQLQSGQLPNIVPVEEMIEKSENVSETLGQKQAQIEELQGKIVELQNSVLDLQENLKEKDSVINARTQAITLLSEDMSKKWRANVDMLEETRQEMHIMQENFVRIEAGLNTEISQLGEQLDTKNKKLVEMEQKLKQTEADRIRLTSCNAELQEEIEHLQKKQVFSGYKENEAKIEELSQSLSEANRLAIKLKAEHKAKVKALSKQIDSLRKESNANEDLIRLQNHITELQEEKSKLQVQLEDFEANANDQRKTLLDLRQTISELTTKLLLSENQPDVTQLQVQLKDKEAEIQQLTSKLHDITDKAKIVSDCEEEKELQQMKLKLSNYENNLISKIEFLERDFDEKLSLTKDLQNVVAEKVQQIEDLAQKATKTDDSTSEMKRFEILLTEKEDKISELTNILSKYANVADECASLKKQIAQVSNERDVAQDQLNAMRLEMSNFHSSQEFDLLKNELLETSNQLKLKSDEHNELEIKLKAQVEKSKKLAANIKIKNAANKELEEKIATYETLVDTNNLHVQKISEEKQNILEKWQTEVSEKNGLIDEISEKLNCNEKKIVILENDVQCKNSVLVQMQDKFALLQKELEDLRSELQQKRTMLDQISTQESSISSSQTEELAILKEQRTSFETQIALLQNQIMEEKQEKENAVSRLESLTKNAKLKLAKEKKSRQELMDKLNELENLLLEKTTALNEVSEQLREEKEKLLNERTLRSQLEDQKKYLESLQQDYEKSVNDRYIAVDFNDQENILMDVSFNSLENENQFESCNVQNHSTEEIISIFLSEKAKTLDKLKLQLEAAHETVIGKMQCNRDIQIESKLFSELKNLFGLVINRTFKLEEEMKKAIVYKEAQKDSILSEAQQNIDQLHFSVTDLNGQLNDQKKWYDDLMNQANYNQQEQEKTIQTLNEVVKDGEALLKKSEKNSVVLESIINEKNQVISTLEEKIKEYLQKNDEMDRQLMEMNNKVVEFESLEECKRKLDMETYNHRNTLEELEQTRIKLREKEENIIELSNENQYLDKRLSDTVQKYSADSEFFNSESKRMELELINLKEQFSIQAMKTPSETDQSANEVESLRNQLAEKTIEVENYQRRLLQLQMEGPTFEEPLVKSNATECNNFEEMQLPLSYFNQSVPNEVDALKQSNADLLQQLEAVRSNADELQKKASMCDGLVFEIENMKSNHEQIWKDHQNLVAELDERIGKLESLLSVAQSQLDHSEDLQSEIKLLKSKIKELEWSCNSLQSEKKQAEKERDGLKEQLSKFNLDKSDCSEVDRPSIPQELDTCISSLKRNDPLSLQAIHPSLTDVEQIERQRDPTLSSTRRKMDESLMERNINQLENELCGMVTSMQEGSSTNQNNYKDESWNEEEKADDSEVWVWDTDDDLPPIADLPDQTPEKGKGMPLPGVSSTPIKKTIVNSELLLNLKERIQCVEQERDTALLQIVELQDEINSLKSNNQVPELAYSSPPLETAIPVDKEWGDNDNWGWETNSAKQEEKIESNEVSVDSNGKIEELQVKVSSLESEVETLVKEKSQLEEDLKSSHVRAVKLAKKYKEIKQKLTDETQSAALLEAPEDSFKTRVDSATSVLSEHNSLLAERIKLQEQLDVLSTANEKILDTKERQDLEIEMWQSRNKDLTDQISLLEDKIKGLEVNEKLPQAQTDIAVNSAELDHLIKENHTWNTNYELLMQEYQKLRAQHLSDGEERAQLDSLVQQQKSMIERLEHEKKYVQDVYDSLKMEYEERKAGLEQLETNYCEESSELKKQVDSLSKENASLQNDSLLHENSRLHSEITSLKEKIGDLENKLKNSKMEVQNNVQSAAVIDWNTMFANTADSTIDVFDNLAENKNLILEEQAQAKDTEQLQMEAHNQKWNQIIEDQRAQLEVAKSNLSERSAELEHNINFISTLNSKVHELEVAVENEKKSRYELQQKLDEKERNQNGDFIEQYQQLQRKLYEKEKEVEYFRQIHKNWEGDVEEGKLSISHESAEKYETHGDKIFDQQNEDDKQLEDYRLLGGQEIRSELVQEIPTIRAQTENHSVNITPIVSPSVGNTHNELDNALNMVYQRDVRCEELTLELTRLLEERDALQLRLSNSIRIIEELRDKAGDLRDKLATSQGDSGDLNTTNFEVSRESLGTENNVCASLAVATNTESKDDQLQLEKKLAELHSVGYGRDKWLQYDRQLRHQQQMQLLTSPSSSQLSTPPEATRGSEESYGTTKLSEALPNPTASDNSEEGQSNCVIS